MHSSLKGLFPPRTVHVLCLVNTFHTDYKDAHLCFLLLEIARFLPSFLKLLIILADGIDVLSVANLLYSSSMYSGGSTLADSCRGMSDRFKVFRNSFFMFWSSVLKSTPSCSERISSKSGTSSSKEECSKLRMGLQAARWTKRQRTAHSWGTRESMASLEPPTALNEL